MAAMISQLEPILLGELTHYRGKIVENVIYDSIDKYTDTMNINNTNQLTDCLNAVEIPVDGLRKYFAELSLLMARRHQIVHQMDRDNKLDPTTGPVTDIDIASVIKWRDALRGFAQDLMALVMPKD
jgi:hypothetical protein